MKFNLTYLSEKSRRAYVLFGLLSGAAVLSSCTHNDPQPIPDQSALAIINASPTKTPVDFYVDNKKLELREALAFGNTTNYLYGAPGAKTGKVTTGGSTTSVGTGKFTLENQRYHTLFIANSADTVTLLRIRDDWPTPRGGYAQIRFVNLSPGAPQYSLEYAGDTTTFNNRAYMEYTPFKYVTAKAQITLNLRNTATNEVVATLPDIELKQNNIYTIWAKGLASQLPTDTAKRIRITRHADNR